MCAPPPPPPPPTGKPYVLPSVLAAEAKMTEQGINKEYAGMVGVQPFVDNSLKFAVRVILI